MRSFGCGLFRRLGSFGLTLPGLLVLSASASSVSQGGSRIAVIGAGVAGCAFTNALLLKGSPLCSKVHVFDGGRGPGGRSSTRKHKHHGSEYVFDHGAQYIGEPKTSEFEAILSKWRAENGCVEEWKGSFGVIGGDNNTQSQKEAPRYVGKPAMSSICSYMLDEVASTNLVCSFGAQVRAVKRASSPYWEVYEDGPNNKFLGEFDWLVSADKANLKDIDNSDVQVFADKVAKHFENKPCLALMVAFHEKDSEQILSKFQFDGALLDKKCAQADKLSWIAKDSSKPGRVRDGKKKGSCYVLHSTPEYAKEIITDITQSWGAEGSPKDVREAIAKAAEELLYSPFLDLIEDQLAMKRGSLQIKPSFIKGHRWGAAFPSPSTKAELDVDLADGRGAHVDSSINFIAVGDYLCTKDRGFARIEGATLSGVAAANALAGI